MNLKNIIGLLAAAILLSAGSAHAQYDSLRNVIKIGGHYQVFGINGIRTEAAGLGFSLEHHTGVHSSWTLDINFIERLETPAELEEAVPQYNDIFQVKVGFRRYFHQALQGPYAGGAIALGIPKENGMSWEIDGNIGYQYRHKRVSIDLMVDIGVGSMVYNNDVYVNGIRVSEERIYEYGFLMRPTLRFGLAL